jgi:hypothetical protein
MLFRPSADQNLDAVHAMLDAWNAEADRFRQAATAARRGEAPTSLTTSAAEDAHDGLMALLGELDDALDKLPAGSVHFTGLLQAQITALALLESVGKSHDILDRFVTEQIAGPRRIGHEFSIAAE